MKIVRGRMAIVRSRGPIARCGFRKTEERRRYVWGTWVTEERHELKL